MHVGSAKLRRRWCSSIKLESGRRYHHLPYNFLIKTAKLMCRSFYSPAFRICIGKKSNILSARAPTLHRALRLHIIPPGTGRQHALGSVLPGATSSSQFCLKRLQLRIFNGPKKGGTRGKHCDLKDCSISALSTADYKFFMKEKNEKWRDSFWELLFRTLKSLPELKAKFWAAALQH